MTFAAAVSAGFQRVATSIRTLGVQPISSWQALPSRAGTGVRRADTAPNLATLLTQWRAFAVQTTPRLRYVDAANGSDTNDGTSLAKAWATVQKALDGATPGTRILLSTGTYKLAQGYGKNGTATQWITIEPISVNAKPVIDASLDSGGTYNQAGLYFQQSSYVGVFGIEVKSQQTLANAEQSGIAFFRGTHHFAVWGCNIHDLPGGAVDCFWVDVNTDYNLPAGGHDMGSIRWNTMHSLARYNPNNASAVSVNGAVDMTAGAVWPSGYAYDVSDNYIYDVLCLQPYSNGGFTYVTDGNGVSIDALHVTNNPDKIAPYDKPVLVTENIITSCGGRAVHVYNSVNTRVVGNVGIGNLRSGVAVADGSSDAHPASPAMVGGVEFDGIVNAGVVITGNWILPLNTPNSLETAAPAAGSAVVGNIVLGGSQVVPSSNVDYSAAGWRALVAGVPQALTAGPDRGLLVPRPGVFTYDGAGNGTFPLVPTVTEIGTYTGSFISNLVAKFAGADAVIVADGSDQTAALQAALNGVAVGSIVQIKGQVRTSAPVIMPAGVVLRGQVSPRWSYQTTPTTSIRPMTGFTGTAAVLIPESTIVDSTVPVMAAARSGYNDNGSLLDLAVDCSAISPSGDRGIYGVFFEGLVRNWRVRNVSVLSSRGKGFATEQGRGTAPPRGLDIAQVQAAYSKGVGISLQTLTDSSVIDLLAVGGDTDGQVHGACSETQFDEIRAVFNKGRGIVLSGSKSSANPVRYGTLSTDRNAKDGVAVEQGGTFPLEITKIIAARDGSSSTTADYAGVVLGDTATLLAPVLIGNIVVTPGYDDPSSAMTGNFSPQHGIRQGNTTRVTVNNRSVWSADTPVLDKGQHANPPFSIYDYLRSGTNGNVVQAGPQVGASTSKVAQQNVLVNPPSGYYLAPQGYLGQSSNGLTQGRQSFVPFLIGPGQTLANALAVNVYTALAGGDGRLRVGIYPSGADGYPDTTKLLASSSINLGTSGSQAGGFGADIAFPPGQYWVSALFVYSTAPSTAPTVGCINNSSYMLPNPTGANINVVRGLFITGQTSLITTAVASKDFQISGNTDCPALFLRAS